MARCEDCIHHECCVRFAGARTLLCGEKADERCKLFKPTSEVVPKSEVDRLNAVMKDMDEQRAYTINMLGENLENAKAEVERLKKDNEYILMQHRFQRRPDGKCWNDVIEKAKTEVAREIFAEIESMLIRYTFDDDYISLGIIDEFSDFKKKFTGEKT